MRKELTEWSGCSVLLSPKESRTITESWPTLGNVILRIFLMLVIDNFVIYSLSNKPCHTNLSGCLVQSSNWWWVPGVITGVLNFCCYGWVHSKKCLCWPPTLTGAFLGRDTSHIFLHFTARESILVKSQKKNDLNFNDRSLCLGPLMQTFVLCIIA